MPTSPTSARTQAVLSKAAGVFSDKPPLLPSETMLHVIPNVILLRAPPAQNYRGTLILSNMRLIFMKYEVSSYITGPEDRVLASVPFAAVESLQKVGGKTRTRGNRYYIEVKCKDFRIYRIGFPRHTDLRGRVFEFLIERSTSSLYLCAFGSGRTMEEPGTGWGLFDDIGDYERTRLVGPLSDGKWTLVTSNGDFMLSPTYPSQFVLPREMTSAEIEAVCAYRSKARLPAAVWRHPNGATLWRCAQPTPGLTGSACEADQKLLNIIQTSLDPQTRNPLMIVDCRMKYAAMGQRVLGRGTEGAQYRNCQLWFAQIPNIHGVRDAYGKLRDAAHVGNTGDLLDPPGSQAAGVLLSNDPHVEALLLSEAVVTADIGDSFLQLLHQSGWFQIIRQILCAAHTVVDMLGRGVPVLIHCSDGWDRTSQVSALAQMLQDPFYRTTRGFAMLTEREWLAFGHKFATRSGVINPAADKPQEESQRSPIFPQFIDCVWQLLQQFPTAFEFNDIFLGELLDQYFGCFSGTFLYDNTRERIYESVPMLTPSVWSLMCLENFKYLNLDYSPTSQVLLPRLHLRTLKFWSKHYCRHIDDQDTYHTYSL